MQPTKSLSILIYRLWHDVTRQRAFQYAMVLIFCVEFRELSHLTRDLSQAEKKIECCYKLRN